MNLTRLIAAAAAPILAAAARAQTAEPYAWDAATHPPQTARLQVWRGDTVPLAPRWGTAATNGWTFTAWWSTNGSAWWSKSLATNPAPSLAGDPFLWTPDMDCGARSYRLFIRAADAVGGSWRANAELAMLDSPGASPASLPPPSAWPGLAAELAPLVAPLIEIVESDPLAGPRIALLEAETNTWRAAYGWGNHALAGYLTSFAESDPLFAAWAGSNTYVRAETDPIAGPRLALVEAETNKWRAAYGWGNHALAGYLTSFAESDPLFAAWAGSNTYVRAESDPAALAALAAYAATNRVTRWHASATNWIESTPSNVVWQVWTTPHGPGTNVSFSADFADTGSQQTLYPQVLPWPFATDGWNGGPVDYDGTPMYAVTSPGDTATWFAEIPYQVLTPAFGLSSGSAFLETYGAGTTTNRVPLYVMTAGERAALAAAAPSWITNSTATGSITLTNAYEASRYVSGTGALAVAFAGLRAPAPVYCVFSGFDTLAFPGAYQVGGGAYQSNAANHMVVWAYGTNVFVSPVTTSEAAQ